MDYAKSFVEKVIHHYSDVVDVERNLDGMGKDVFILSDGIIIRLNSDYSRISHEWLEAICEHKLRIDRWEFDYILDNIDF